MALTIPQHVLDHITAAATSAHPAECCGLLIGVAAGPVVRVSRAVACRNLLAEETQDRFELDPAARFQVMRELRSGPERIVGHYHSHPGRSSVPSAHDQMMIHEPELVWVIAGTDGIRAWMADGGRLREITSDNSTTGRSSGSNCLRSSPSHRLERKKLT